MTNKKLVNPITTHYQLSMEEFQKELNAHLGEPIKREVVDADIGGELLSILSKGLYPSPLDCIREYVQNAVDAQAHTVTIRITGNSVVIHDDGQGMSIAEIVDARKFGVSTKSIATHVGFRGIGLYSGFDICNRLVLTTKKAGDDHQYVLEIEFGKMKTVLDDERSKGKSERTPLTKLLTDHSQYRSESEDNIDLHYTTVQLEELSNTHIGELANRQHLRAYILKNLPIDFNDDFKYKQLISQALRRNVPGYNAVIIRLESDTQDMEVIARPSIPDLETPRMGFITNSNKKDVAYYWSCLYLAGSKIPDQYMDYRGFTYKVKGFTIGNNQTLNKVFKKGGKTLYDWLTGEVFVLDQNVVPNAARNDFEPSQAKILLTAAVEAELKKVETEASKFQQRHNADKVVAICRKDLEIIQEKMNDPYFNAQTALDVHHNLLGIHTRLNEKKKTVSDKEALIELVQYTEQLIRSAKKKIEEPVNSSTRVIIEAPPQQKTELASKSQLSEESTKSSVRSEMLGLFEFQNIATETNAAPKGLIELLETCGWGVCEEDRKLIQILDSSLSETLSNYPDIYELLLDDIEARLNADA